MTAGTAPAEADGSGAREVVAVGEVLDDGRGFAVRPLLVRGPAGPVVEGRPQRGGRRGTR